MAASSSSAATVKPSDHSSPAEETEQETEFCRGFKDAEAFVKHGLGAVVSATKASAALPAAGDEFDLYRSFPAFQQFCASQGDRLLHCMSQIMQHHGCRSHMSDRNRLTGLEDRFDLVVDSNDAILEKVGILLDEASGVSRSQQPVMPAGYQPPKIVVSSWNRRGGERREETFHLLHAKNIQRPQLKFKDKVDNSNTPFVSKIFIKPNAVKPLPSYFADKHIRKERPEDLDVPAALADFIHQQRTQEHVFSSLSLRHIFFSTCQFINTLDDLVALNEKLAKVSEFAVDLEHHSYRSFLGITCLMQISTREEDFIIDTLELRSEMYILNETFTDPAIVKVFHGADSDIEWLQKDFGLYVVNMFDTHHAARCLNLGRNSLDHLLKVYCSVNSDKRYQLADWRIRPLPEEMLKYAQADTHYLLYVYDRVRADLFETSNSQPTLIQQVWAKSRDLSLKKYVKPIFTEDSYMELYRKQKRSFNTQQLAAFRLLYAWRDKLGREEDESTGYILPNHMMMKIAEELPKEPQGIMACCNPTPPLVRQQINELHQLIKQARETPLLKAEVLAEKRKSMTPKRKPQPTSFGPHDTSRSSESDFLDLSSFETPTKPGVLLIIMYEGSVLGPLLFIIYMLPLDDTQLPFQLSLSHQLHISFIEQQQQEAQEKRQAKEQAKKAQEERKKAKLSYQESLQNVHTVRQQVMEAKQAGQKRESAASDVGEESLKPNIQVSKTESETSVADQSTKPAQKKKNVQEPEVPKQNFKPFDYSKSNFKIFAGKSKESSQFDPNRQAHGPKQKKNQKGQKKSAVGGRSMSYVPAKSDR
uniref:Exosome complex component 10 n=1 Tax=Cyprinus carpio TaxID=7962 RepID=A0A8C1KYI1_CYPCA